jgi:hypothetical protein
VEYPDTVLPGQDATPFQTRSTAPA